MDTKLAPPSAQGDLPGNGPGGASSHSLDGLTSEEARRLLATHGANAMPDASMPVALPATFPLAAAAVFAIVIDLPKAPLFRRLNIN